MGNFPSSGTQGDQSYGERHNEKLIKDIWSHLETLENTALSIRSTTDAQYELVQSFFKGQENFVQPVVGEENNGACAVVTLNDVKDHEKKVLPFLQDSICVQAGMLKNTVEHLKDLARDVNLSSPSAKKTMKYPSISYDEEVNKSRRDVVELRIKYAEQERKLRETDREISELSNKLRIPISRYPTELDSVSESEREQKLRRGGSHHESSSYNDRENGSKSRNIGSKKKKNNQSYGGYQQYGGTRSMEELQNKISNLKTEITDLKAEIKQKDDEIKATSESATEAVFKLSNEIKKRKDINESLEGKINDLNEELNQSREKLQEYKGQETKIEGMKRKNEYLQDELAEKKNELRQKKEENADLERQLGNIGILQSEIKDLRRKLDNANEDNSNLRTDIRKSQQEVEQLVEENKTFRENENRNLEKIKSMEDINQSLQTDISELTQKKETTVQEIQMKETMIRNLSSENDSLSEKCKHLKNNYETELKDVKRQNREQLDKIKELRYENRDISTTLDQFRNINRKLDSEVHQLKKKVKELEREKEIALEEIRRKRKVSVMMYAPGRGELLTMVLSELRYKLTDQFGTQQADLTIQECNSVDQIDTSKPVLVLCINASRLGTDVSAAMNGVRGSSQVAVVVLHHKEVHALPTQSSGRVLTSQEYKSLGAIVDMACLSGKGLYPCDMNRAAMNLLMDFIKQRNIQT